MIISRASLIFPLLVSIYIVLNINGFLKIIRNRRVVPSEFKMLFLFIVVHTIIYVAFNLQSIGFGTEMGDANDEGFAYGKSSSGIVIIRYFLFLIFSLFLTIAIGNDRNLKVFSTSFSLGFMLTIFLGAFHGYNDALVRFSGGLQDPNAMAFDGLISFLFSFYLFSKYKNGIYRFFLVLSMTVSIIAVLLSFSRGAYLALLVWVLLYLHHQGIFKSIWKAIVVCSIVGTLGFFVMQQLGVDMEVIDTRLSIEEMRENKGANRMLIWEAYLSNIDKYVITGTGINNSPIIMRGNKLGLPENYQSHNLYIQFFAEFGIIGLLLYLFYWYGYIREYRKTRNNYYILMTMGGGIFSCHLLPEYR